MAAKHIVIDARIINSTTGTYVERLLHYLQKLDTTNRYTVLIPSADKDFWQPTAKNFTVLFADYDDYSFEEQLGFKTFLDELKADLVHFCVPQQPVRYKGKKVTTIHDLTLLRVYNSDKNYFIFKAKQLVGRYVFWKVARDSVAIITPTEYTKQDLLNFAKIPSSKVHVTYEAADIGQFKPISYEVPFKRFLINVGRHSDYKNCVRLAEAHQKLLEKHPDLGLVFVNGPDDSVLANKELFEKRGYKNIHFTLKNMKGERDYLYGKALAYVTPSLNEGFGLGALEAMGFGLPVVSSTATCLPEVYADGALYFDPLDVDDMAEKIEQVVSNEKLRKDLIKKGLARHKTFSWEKMAKETLEVYQKALKD
ncbi:MAG TPA: glycosyltransferase family 1 protein [Candidatus Saccharibacteria bacterium]|nr:glycosyltransferase family 1 protein [Candidatus Saccharibacteria bacterium]